MPLQTAAYRRASYFRLSGTTSDKQLPGSSGSLFKGRCFKPRALKHASGPSRRTNSPVLASREDFSDKLGGVAKTASSVVDTVVDIIPGDIPRPTARLGVIVVGSLIAVSLVQKILSTALSLAVVAAAGYFFYNTSGIDSSSSKTVDAGESDDPIADAKKIMDKYK